MNWLSHSLFAQVIDENLKDTLLKEIDKGMLSTIRYRPTDSLGAIGLPFLYSSPCLKNSEIFSELYYWDAFFVNRYYWLPKAKLGNMQAMEVALGNVNNLLFLVNKFGFVPNANRYSMLNRSQLPLLSEMVKDVFEISGDVNWLQKAVEDLEKEHQFWMQNRAVQLKISGKYINLNRYGNQASMEQLMGFYTFLKQRLKPNLGYNKSGKLQVPSSLFDPQNQRETNQLTRDSLLFFASHLLAEAESGWDFTPRFHGRCMDYLPVDLNAVLGSMERNMVEFYGILQAFETDTYRRDIQTLRLLYYLKASKLRKLAMDKYLWNRKRGCYMDFNWRKVEKGQPLLTAASFWPIYLNWGKESNLRSIQRMLGSLMFKDAVMPLDVKVVQSMPYSCQWTAPNVWAPLQIVVWESLHSDRMKNEFWRQFALRNCWIELVANQWKVEHAFKEKYSILTDEMRVADFLQIINGGNALKYVGGKFLLEEGYGTPSMMGWTAAITYFFLLTP